METIYKEIEKKVDDLIELMRVRINEEGVKTKKLAEIIQMALGMAGDSYKALIEGKMEPDRIPGCIRQYFNCIKIIVEANWKAQSILNPNIEMPSIEEQYAEELEKEQNKKLQTLYPQYF